MEFILAQEKDIPLIMDIYEKGRAFMRLTGNMYQWNGGYPSEEVVSKDIEGKNLYLCIDEGEPAAVFALLDGPDKTYNIIKDGKWLSSAPYGVIHRIVVLKHGRGIAKACFDFGMKKYANIRIDTHKDNLPMRRALEKNGFSQCGIIFLENGEERIAFQKEEK